MSTTTIRFTLPAASRVTLTVYDVEGRTVRRLVSGPRAANAYAVEWDARNDSGDRVSSGVYFYELRAGRLRATRKMVLLK